MDGDENKKSEMRFDIDGQYPKAEFLKRLRFFESAEPGLSAFLQYWIPRIEKYADDAIFVWRTDDDGAIRPKMLVLPPNILVRVETKTVIPGVGLLTLVTEEVI